MQSHMAMRAMEPMPTTRRLNFFKYVYTARLAMMRMVMMKNKVILEPN